MLFNKFSFFYSIISRSSGYGNDAVSPPVLASLDGKRTRYRRSIIGPGEFIVLEVPGTNNRLGLEEVYMDGLYFQRLKPNDYVAQFEICHVGMSC